MKVEIVTENNIWQYMPILNADEFDGITAGRYTCFGAYDEVNELPIGVATAQVFPKQIRIHRIYTVPDHRRQGVASELLRVMTDLPEDVKLHFTIACFDASDDYDFLAHRGFKEMPSDFTYITSDLSNMKDVQVPAKLRVGIDLMPMDRAPVPALESFILSSQHDVILQFPEFELDTERFSDASIVCQLNGQISAAIMLEEFSDAIQVTWFGGTDGRSIYCSFYMLKQALESEFDTSQSIRVLLHKNKGLDAIEKVFHSVETHPVRFFAL